MDKIQKELDIAEEYILTKLIGNTCNPIISSKLKFLLSTFNINIENVINEKLLVFESLSRMYMTEDGYYDGNKLGELIGNLLNCEKINLPNIKPIDVAIFIDNLLNIDSIGKLIQNP